MKKSQDEVFLPAPCKGNAASLSIPVLYRSARLPRPEVPLQQRRRFPEMCEDSLIPVDGSERHTGLCQPCHPAYKRLHSASQALEI